MAVAWIIEWRRFGKVPATLDLRPHILPGQWRSDRVFDYLRCLYWNSPLWTPLESLKRVHLRMSSDTIVEVDEPRIIYGNATHLIASHVRDLEIETDPSGQVVLQWTSPAGRRINSTTKTFSPVGTPTKRRYQWSPPEAKRIQDFDPPV